MDKHVSDESPSLVSLVRIVYQLSGDWSSAFGMVYECVNHEQDEFYDGDDYHAYGWWPARVLLLVLSVCKYHITWRVRLGSGMGQGRTFI